MKEDRPSATARTIALGTVLLKSDPRLGRWVPDEAAELCRGFLEAASPRGLNLARLCDRRWFRALMGWMERATLPGLGLHYALRKRFIEEVARRSLRDGTRQVVVLGGGFDTLALRLHAEFPGTLFIEIDHPATQRIKVKALDGRPSPGPNLRFVSSDFTRETIEEALLKRTPFDSSIRTHFVREGVLMYLAKEDIRLHLHGPSPGRKVGVCPKQSARESVAPDDGRAVPLGPPARRPSRVSQVPGARTGGAGDVGGVPPEVP